MTICVCVRSHCGMSSVPSCPKWWETCELTCVDFWSWIVSVCLLPSLLSFSLSCFSTWPSPWLSFILISMENILKWKWLVGLGWGGGKCWQEREKKNQCSIAIFNTLSCFSRCPIAPKGINQLCGSQKGLGRYLGIWWIGGRRALVYSPGQWRHPWPSQIPGMGFSWSWSPADRGTNSSKASLKQNWSECSWSDGENHSRIFLLWGLFYNVSLESCPVELRAAHRACPDTWAALPKLWLPGGGTSSFRMSGTPSQHVTKGKFVCPMHTVRPNKPKRRSLEQRKFYCRATQGDGWLMPQTPRGFQQGTFKGMVQEGCGWLFRTFVQESFVLAAVHVGQVMMFL